MSSEIEYKSLRKSMIKDYLQEALALCLSCTDLMIEMPCTANCSQQYLAFLYGKNILEQKLTHCKTLCSLKKNSSENKNCMNYCYKNSSLDLVSLDILLKL